MNKITPSQKTIATCANAPATMAGRMARCEMRRAPNQFLALFHQAQLLRIGRKIELSAIALTLNLLITLAFVAGDPEVIFTRMDEQLCILVTRTTFFIEQTVGVI